MLTARDFPPEERAAAELLLGRRLADDEGFAILPCAIIQEPPSFQARLQDYAELAPTLDAIADRVKHIPIEELYALIDEVCYEVRHGVKPGPDAFVLPTEEP